MIGIDTNVLVRLHIQDDKDQFQKAKRLAESCSTDNPLFISNLVLIEWCWVMLASYKVPKRKIIEEIEVFINAGDVILQNQDACRKALNLYKNNNADFADCLIGVLNQQSNCKTTYTFDKKASNLTLFTLLQ